MNKKKKEERMQRRPFHNYSTKFSVWTCNWYLFLLNQCGNTNVYKQVQDKSAQESQQADSGEMLDQLKQSFEQELREVKQKAANEFEILTRKVNAEADVLREKLSEESATRVELDKKAR